MGSDILHQPCDECLVVCRAGGIKIRTFSTLWRVGKNNNRTPALRTNDVEFELLYSQNGSAVLKGLISHISR